MRNPWKKPGEGASQAAGDRVVEGEVWRKQAEGSMPTTAHSSRTWNGTQDSLGSPFPCCWLIFDSVLHFSLTLFHMKADILILSVHPSVHGTRKRSQGKKTI